MEAARVLPLTLPYYLAFEEFSAASGMSSSEEKSMRWAARASRTTRFALNVATALRTKLRGGSVPRLHGRFQGRSKSAARRIFYYPDVVVSCHPTGIEKHFLRYPTLVFEVLSPRPKRSIVGKRSKIT